MRSRPIRPVGRTDRLPRAAIALAAIGAALFAIPLLALLWRMPWESAWAELASAEVATALRLSLVCSLSATALSAVFGLPLGWVQARAEFPGRSLLRALTLVPVVLPPVVGGVALLMAFGRRGPVGAWLEATFGVRLPFSIAGAILAETFVAMPFFVLTVEGGLRSIDRRLEDAARTLGARPWTVFRRVTLPLLRPSLVAGLALCWARALGEFGATIMFAGNVEGRTRTLPLLVYSEFQDSVDAAAAAAAVLVVAALGVLVAVRVTRWRSILPT